MPAHDLRLGDAPHERVRRDALRNRATDERHAQQLLQPAAHLEPILARCGLRRVAQPLLGRSPLAERVLRGRRRRGGALDDERHERIDDGGGHGPLIADGGKEEEEVVGGAAGEG